MFEVLEVHVQLDFPKAILLVCEIFLSYFSYLTLNEIQAATSYNSYIYI